MKAIEVGPVGIDSGLLLLVDPAHLGLEFMEQLRAHRREDGSFSLSYLTPESGANGALGVIVPVEGDGLYSVTQLADGAVVID
jgi:hypothetical protein